MADKYTHAGQQRILKIILALAGHEFNGLSPTQIAKAIKASASAMTRDLDNLQTAGFVEELPELEHRWRLGPKAIQIFRAHTLGMERIRERVAELDQRFSREPK